MNSVINVLSSAALFWTVYGLFITIPLFFFKVLPAAINRYLHSTWWKDSKIADDATLRETYVVFISEYNTADSKFGRKAALITCLVPLYFLFFSADEDKSRGFLYVAIFNALVAAIYQLLKKDRFETYSTRLKAMQATSSYNPKTDRGADDELQRAERQAHKDREYGERRTREEAKKRRDADEAERRRKQEKQQRKEDDARRARDEQKRSEGRANDDGSSSNRNARKDPHSKAWHVVLGVPESASTKEIRTAYISLLKQYHPDRVFDLGDDLKELANQKTAEINKAYGEAMAGR